jgi:hypothetical protein
MSRPSITLERAVKSLTEHWAACRDAAGLAYALEDMGVIVIDRSNTAEALVREADQYCSLSSFVEVSPAKTLELVRLITRMKNALEGK